MSLMPFIHNIALLIALLVVHSQLHRYIRERSLFSQILSGALFGIVAIIGMVSAMEIQEGFFFDGRTVILFLAGSFGGPLTGAVAMVSAGIFRLTMDGGGMVLGILFVLTSGGFGMAYYTIRKRYPIASSPLAFYLSGLLLHGIVMMYIFFLPTPGIMPNVLLALMAVFLGIYPLATMLLSVLFLSQEKQTKLISDLSDSEERFRSLFHNSQAIHMIIDPVSGQIAEANKTAEAFYGWPLEELRQKSIFQINTLPESVMKKRLAASLKEEEQFFETRHRLASGQVKEVEVHAGPVTIDGKAMIFSIVHDITDIKRSKEELQKERMLLRTVIDNLPATIYLKDLELRKVLANKADLAIIGKPEEEVIGKKDSDIFPPDIAARLEEDDRRIIEKGETIVNREEKYVDTEGRETWLLTTKTPFRDQEGKVTGIIGIGQNFTEQVEASRQLKRAREEAEDANQAKSEFIANVSHEIRTPMNVILGFSEMLYEQTENPSRKNMLESILSSGKLLLTLLNDILDLSKIEAGKMDLLPRPVNMRTMTEEIKMLYEGNAREKGLDLLVEIPDDFPQIMELDEVRMKQVLFNLVGNAVKFTSKGHIAISLAFQPGNNESGLFTLRVSDTGIGISADQQENIFMPFYQQSGKKNRQYGGTGLGLPITRRLIEKMHGKVVVESEPGKGSVFIVTIPHVPVMKEQETTVSTVGSKNMAIRFEPAKVLVVDDSAANRQLLDVLLSTAGLEVIDAEDGAVALDFLKRNKPDLIILDILMPGLDGYEVATAIKADKRLREVPLIAYTAYVHHAAKISDTGLFDNTLFKPVKQQDLLRMLSQYLKHRFVHDKSRDTKKKITTQAAFTISPEELTDAMRSCLPGFIEELKTTFLPRWSVIKDHWVLFRIEEFARSLHTRARAQGFDFIVNWCDLILTHIDNLDLEALKKDLGKFPVIIKEMEELT